MYSTKEYENNEIRNAKAHIFNNERTPRIDQFFEEFKEANFNHIQQQTEWLLNGSYGYGEMLIAQQIVEHGKKSKRFNRNASLFQLLAVLNWLIPSRICRKIWNESSEDRKAGIDEAINQAVICDKERQEG